MYKLLSRLAFDNHDTLSIYFKLFSVTDSYLHRLVRSKLLTIFKPVVRRAFTLNASGTHQGVLGGTQSVLKQLKEQKEENTFIKASIILTKTTGKGKGKPNLKGAKKGTAGGQRARVNAITLKTSPKVEPKGLQQLLDIKRTRLRS